ncbi:large subunit ribosomal protein L23Ae [Nematocida homosporus]|uniref:large subunit ribosomal protein L23Ae n=1 Tax=Nematocida homosporus TaxID=1912981 RepID=UPI0022209952|nr:large subunit ribosomal protein L23Ae [Nematocida homosporus]KAI5187097.1 large subunit ribosomal protein L23Ae [Nematocida homosporus]
MSKAQYKKSLKLSLNELKTPKGRTPEDRMKSIKVKLPQDIIKCAAKTEKAMKAMEKHNTIIFVCDLKATKPEIKEAIQKLYSVKPKKVNTAITFKGEKRAYAIFGAEHSAIEIASAADIL